MLLDVVHGSREMPVLFVVAITTISALLSAITALAGPCYGLIQFVRGLLGWDQQPGPLTVAFGIAFARLQWLFVKESRARMRRSGSVKVNSKQAEELRKLDTLAEKKGGSKDDSSDPGKKEEN